MAELRWYQTKAVEIFATLPEPRRYFLPWDMGAGKTLGAIAIAKAYNRKRVLIVAPALVRENWGKELEHHWPEAQIGVVRWGRKRKLSEAEAEVRDLSFKAPIQIVSYDLLRDIDPLNWDMIIVDEFHNLRSPRSVQSKNILKLFRQNPDAWAVGLSGTPIPNEARQLWNPVDTFFPNLWGKRTTTNNEAWDFLWKYCETEQTSYGRSFYGLKPDMREPLQTAFAAKSFRIVQKDFAEYLPPLFVEPMFVSDTPDPVKLALDWYESVKDECAHVGIYTHFRKTAYDIAIAFQQKYGDLHVNGITGATATDVRARLLQGSREASESVIVGTTHALNEGISLSFQKAALIVEWTTQVDQVTQFIARFARQDSVSQAPTCVKFVVGPKDEGKASVLRGRMDAINSVIKASKPSEIAAEVFAEREMSDEDFAAQLDLLVSKEAKRSSLWAPTDDDEDTDDD